MFRAILGPDETDTELLDAGATLGADETDRELLGPAVAVGKGVVVAVLEEAFVVLPLSKVRLKGSEDALLDGD